MNKRSFAPAIVQAAAGVVDIRHELHAHPELMYSEHRTAEIIRANLSQLGIPVVGEFAGTGIVGALRLGSSTRTLGLRADMDALSISEATELPYSSTVPGVMHACGHDGHVAILLATARYLAETRKFDGTVFFIFQPAEEGGSGARKMVKQGLFEMFSMDEIYAIHNWPSLPSGHIAVSSGPVMASTNDFKISIDGPGGHAAFPHQTVDLIGVAADIIQKIRSLVSSRIDPMSNLALAITKVLGGTTVNAFPATVEVAGTVRAFDPKVVDKVESLLREIVENSISGSGATSSVFFERKYPATINYPDKVSIVQEAALRIVPFHEFHAQTPAMTSEDFSYMLAVVPGCYIFLGNGLGFGNSPNLHTPTYDFDDESIPVGVALLSGIVEIAMPASLAEESTELEPRTLTSQ